MGTDADIYQKSNLSNVDVYPDSVVKSRNAITVSNTLPEGDYTLQLFSSDVENQEGSDPLYSYHINLIRTFIKKD